MTNQQVFLEHPDEELMEPGYQALSPLAVIAFLLGIGSSLVLLSPLFLIVPVAALAASVAALLQIANNPDLTGRRIALAGVVLALLFATWEPSYLILRNRKLNQEARAFSSAWLNLISQGRYYEAHQWSEPYPNRRSTSEGLAHAYETDAKALRAFEDYFARSPFDIHASKPPEMTIEYLGGESVEISADDSAFVKQRFRISYQTEDGFRSEVILVTARRGVLEDDVLWQLFDFETSS